MLKKSLLIVASLCAASYAQSSKAPIKPMVQLTDDYKLVWSDEFDGKDVDLDKNWESQNGPSGHILSSRWRENAKVADGFLRLINRKEQRGGQDWTSGSIWSLQKYQYGYFECRYRYAAATGTNNSFWIMMLGDKPKVGKYFEIDINEGHYPNEVNTNIHNHTDVKVVNGRRTHPAAGKSFNFGLRPDRVVQLEMPITTNKIRLISDENQSFHINEFQIFGTSTKGYPSVLPRKDAVEIEGLVDFARDPSTKIKASGFHESQKPSDIKNLTDGDIASGWISQNDGPKWLEFEFEKPQTVGCVQFINGWRENGDWRGLLKEYKVQYWNGQDWVDISSFDQEKMATDFAKDFHTFGLQWTEQDIIFYLDGKQLRKEKNEFCFSPAPVWLSLAIIPWAGKVTDAIDGTFMEVDYVRIYQRPTDIRVPATKPSK